MLKRCAIGLLLRRLIRVVERIAVGIEEHNTLFRIATHQPDPALESALEDAEASVTVMTDSQSQEYEEEDLRNARLF